MQAIASQPAGGPVDCNRMHECSLLLMCRSGVRGRLRERGQVDGDRAVQPRNAHLVDRHREAAAGARRLGRPSRCAAGRHRVRRTEGTSTTMLSRSVSCQPHGCAVPPAFPVLIHRAFRGGTHMLRFASSRRPRCIFTWTKDCCPSISTLAHALAVRVCHTLRALSDAAPSADACRNHRARCIPSADARCCAHGSRSTVLGALCLYFPAVSPTQAAR